YVVEELGVHRVYFVDDNLGQDRERFEAILDGLISLRESGRDVTWETPNGIRTDRLTFDLLKKAKRAGCRSIVLTVESGSQRVLDEVIGKRLDLDKVVEVAGWCKRLGLKARSGFIVGLPGETLEEMEETVRFARMLRRRFGIHGHLSTATPYFGTRLYDICREGNFIQGEMTPERLAVAIQGEGIVATPAFSVEDVKAVRRRFERRGMLQTAGKWIERTVKRLVRPRRRVHQHG
ncbi:MAG TPA: radical SAM protein, partial [Planctomycetota bacterium]|nr:radical SAM protein [Planctomycetota bacterium]